MTAENPQGKGQPDPTDPEYHLPKEHWPLPELSTVGEGHPHPSANRYVTTQASPDFQQLRSTFRNFAFPTLAAVLVWYFAYVALSVFAGAFMKQPGWAGLSVGLWLSFAQFPTTWLATWLYVRHANHKLDPLAEKIRTELEAGGTAK